MPQNRSIDNSIATSNTGIIRSIIRGVCNVLEVAMINNNRFDLQLWIIEVTLWSVPTATSGETVLIKPKTPKPRQPPSLVPTYWTYRAIKSYIFLSN